MGITRQRAAAACRAIVRDQEELGALVALVDTLTDERLALLDEGDSNKAIVAFLRTKAAAGGAGPGPGSTRNQADMVTALRKAPPAAEYRGRRTRLGTKGSKGDALDPRRPHHVRQWTSFPKEAEAWCCTTEGQLEGKTIPSAMFNSWQHSWPITYKSNLYMYLTCTAWMVVEALSEAALGVPLDGYDELRKLRTNRGPTPYELHVEQLFRYMLDEGVRYGMLCSDEAYWPAMLSGPAEQPALLIAAPVQRESKQPSAVGAVLYLCYLSLQQPPPLPPQGPVPCPGPGQDAGHASRGLDPSGLGQAVVAQLLQLAQAGLAPLVEAPTSVVLSLEEVGISGLLGEGITGAVYRATYLGEPAAIKAPARGRRCLATTEGAGGSGSGTSFCAKFSKDSDKDGGSTPPTEELACEVVAYLCLAELQGRHIPRLLAYGSLLDEDGVAQPVLVLSVEEGAEPLDEAAYLACWGQPPRSGAGPPFTRGSLETGVQGAVQGVQAMHMRGVAHGDLGASNCLVTPEGRALWVDLARATVGATALDKAEDWREFRRLAESLGLGHLVGALDPLSPATWPAPSSGGGGGSQAAMGRGEREALEVSLHPLVAAQQEAAGTNRSAVDFCGDSPSSHASGGADDRGSGGHGRGQGGGDVRALAVAGRAAAPSGWHPHRKPGRLAAPAARTPRPVPLHRLRVGADLGARGVRFAGARPA